MTTEIAIVLVHKRIDDKDALGLDGTGIQCAIGDAGNRHMMCRIPGGARVEFFAPPAA